MDIMVTINGFLYVTFKLNYMTIHQVSKLGSFVATNNDPLIDEFVSLFRGHTTKSNPYDIHKKPQPPPPQKTTNRV